MTRYWNNTRTRYALADGCSMWVGQKGRCGLDGLIYRVIERKTYRLPVLAKLAAWWKMKGI